MLHIVSPGCSAWDCTTSKTLSASPGRRFGRELPDAFNAVTGDRPCPITPVRPPPTFAAAAENYLDPIVTRPGIDLAVDRLLDRLCTDLAGAGQGAQGLVFRAFRVDGNVQELAVATGLPTRNPQHLWRLFAQVLERLEPDFGFERISLQAGETNVPRAGQDGIRTVAEDPRRDAAALSELLDRLLQRVAVWRYQPQESHWPERAVHPVDPFTAVARAGTWPGQEHPVRVLARSVPLMVVASVPDGPPNGDRAAIIGARLLVAEGRVERETDRAEVPITHLTCRRLHDRSDLLNGLMQAEAGCDWGDVVLLPNDEVRRPAPGSVQPTVRMPGSRDFR